MSEKVAEKLTNLIIIQLVREASAQIKVQATLYAEVNNRTLFNSKHEVERWNETKIGMGREGEEEERERGGKERKWRGSEGGNTCGFTSTLILLHSRFWVEGIRVTLLGTQPLYSPSSASTGSS